MQGIDLLNMDEKQWLLMTQLKKYSWGMWHNLKSCEALLDKFKKELHLMTMQNQGEAKRMYMQVLARYMKLLVQKLLILDILEETVSESVLWIVRFSEHYSKRFHSDFIFEEGMIWPTIIPQSYRYRVAGFINSLLYGANLFIKWSQELYSLKMSLCYDQIQTGYIDDLPFYYHAYMIEFCKKEAFLKGLRKESWFWHFALRRMLDEELVKIREEKEALKNLVHQLLDTQSNASEVGRLLHIDGFYQNVFNDIFSKKEIQQLESEWQVYHPRYLAALRHTSGSKLGEQDNHYWNDRHRYFLLQSIQYVKGDAYRYSIIIEWLFENQVAEKSACLRHCYQETIGTHPLFWEQLYQAVKYKHVQDVSAMVESYKSKTTYEFNGFKKMFTIQPYKINFSNMSIEQSEWLLSNYDRCISGRFIMRYLSYLRNTTYQFCTGIKFHTLQRAYCMWASVSMVVSLPTKLDAKYIEKLNELFKHHDVLPMNIKLYLHSHMAVLAKFFWLKAWHGEDVVELSCKVNGFGEDTWHKGMLQIQQNIADLYRQKFQTARGGENDLSKGVFSECTQRCHM